MNATNYSVIPDWLGRIAIAASLIFAIFALACSTNAGVAREVQNAEPAFRTSAYLLLRDYLANEADADLKYQNKIILVDGVIDRTVSGPEPKVYFAGGNGLTELSCGLDSREAGTLTNHRMGQEATFKGKVTGKRSFHVELQGCIMQTETSANNNDSTLFFPTSTTPPTPTLVPRSMIIEGQQGLITEAFLLNQGQVTFATTYRKGQGSAITVYLRRRNGEDVQQIAYGRELNSSLKAVSIDEPGYYVLEIEAGDGVWSIEVK
jgi:hypothetical protein